MVKQHLSSNIKSRRSSVKPRANPARAGRTQRALSHGAGSRVDPRVLRTREFIVIAFKRELQDKGFEALSVQDLVRRAGINRATFYDHFEDKFALASHVIRSELENAFEKSGLKTRRLDADALSLLMQTICAILFALHKHCKPPHVQVDSLVEMQTITIVEDLLAVWLRSPPEGWRKFSLSQRATAATAVSWAFYGLALSGVAKAGHPPGRAFIESAVQQVANFMGAPDTTLRS
jgi:AcrR family transcriptional regulator